MQNAAKYWSEIALEALREDFSARLGPQHPGPGRSSRALALAHAAFHDAYVSGAGAGRSYRFDTPARIKPSQMLAQLSAGRAAFQTLQALYSRQAEALAAHYSAFTNAVSAHSGTIDPAVMKEAERIGDQVAADLHSARAADTMRGPPFTPLLPARAHGAHEADPISGNIYGGVPSNYGEYWGVTRPFVLTPLEMLEVRAGPPPSIGSKRYRADYDEVRSHGHVSRRDLTNAATRIGFFWAYDGTRQIGTPPRLYNQVVHRIAEEDKLTEGQWSELLCRCNLALADAAIATWSAKFFYYLWRPVVGIRQDLSQPDLAWRPVGAPATNNPNQVDFTPPFPAYPSGHATFGAACFETVKLFRNREMRLSSDAADRIDLEIVSDELDGRAYDFDPSMPRPRVPMRFNSIDQMIRDNLESRVWLGVHWRFDGDAGETCGRDLARRAYERF